MKKVFKIFWLFSLLFFVSTNALIAQEDKDDDDKKKRSVIQFSGVVVASDSLNPIPFATIIIRNSNRGTTSDYYGYFSFVAQELDTIEFSSVGYKKSTFVIPGDLEEQRYSMIQMLEKDTIQLEEAMVYPWPTREQFKEAFLNADPPDDDLERARRNLAQGQLAERAESMPMTGSMNFKYQMQQKQTRLYHSGQYPSVSLFNPVAWAEFIKAWKRGDFKSDDRGKYDEYNKGEYKYYDEGE